MNQIELETLLKNLLKTSRETEWLEFKKNNYNPAEIGERISALSNSANVKGKDYGYLVFGVDNDTLEVVGTKFSPKTLKKGNEEVEHWLAQRLNPRIDFSIFEFSYNGKEVVLFKIPAAINKPTSFSNEDYIRVGSITRKLKDFPEKERLIWNNSQKKCFEKMVAKKGLELDEVLELLDFSSYFTLTGQQLPSKKENFLDVMAQDGLVVKDGLKYDITNLGALLFAKNVKVFETIKRKAVRVIQYKGKNRVETVKEQEGGLGYAVGFTRLIDYINNQLPSNEEVTKALRKERKMYPEIAIRELVANALIHQDLSVRGAGSIVEIFTDRIEITNPGAPLIDVDRFIDHSPQSRNEDLASFMRRIKICEERGSGIDKVIFHIELFQLPAPRFEAADKFTKVILYAPAKLSSMKKEDRIRACYQHSCLKFVSNDKMSNTSLRERFAIKTENYPMASRIIADTVKAGLIKPDNPEQRKHAKYIPFWA